MSSSCLKWKIEQLSASESAIAQEIRQFHPQPMSVQPQPIQMPAPQTQPQPRVRVWHSKLSLQDSVRKELLPGVYSKVIPEFTARSYNRDIHLFREKVPKVMLVLLPGSRCLWNEDHLTTSRLKGNYDRADLLLWIFASGDPNQWKDAQPSIALLPSYVNSVSSAMEQHVPMTQSHSRCRPGKSSLSSDYGPNSWIPNSLSGFYQKPTQQYSWQSSEKPNIRERMRSQVEKEKDVRQDVDSLLSPVTLLNLTMGRNTNSQVDQMRIRTCIIGRPSMRRPCRSGAVSSCLIHRVHPPLAWRRTSTTGSKDTLSPSQEEAIIFRLGIELVEDVNDHLTTE
eukprot:1679485-Amphidinium_carterae.2